jgi:hypothetical protein
MMTLAQIRHELRGLQLSAKDKKGERYFRKMADAIDAHLKSAQGPVACEPDYWAAISVDEGEVEMAWSTNDANEGEAARTEANQWINDQPHPASFHLAPLYKHPTPPPVTVQVPDEIGIELCAPISHEWMARRTGYREGWNNCIKKMRELNATPPAASPAGYDARKLDADRYEWLRSRDGKDSDPRVEIYIDGHSYNPGHLDRAVDDAMMTAPSIAEKGE